MQVVQCTRAPGIQGPPTAWAVIFYASKNTNYETAKNPEIMKYTHQMHNARVTASWWYSHAKVIDYVNISKFGMNKVRKFAMKFSYLILSKIVKIVATRGHILRQKCTKIPFRWGSLQRSPSPLALLLRDEDGGGREGEERWPPPRLPRVGWQPHVQHPEKYHVCVMFTSSPLRM